MAFHPFSLLFLLASCVYSQYILPKRCPSLRVQCVGEGSSCGADWDVDYCQAYAGSWSVCNKCGDDSLICHGGKCMKMTQGRNEPCNPANHLWCQPGLDCSPGPSGVCVDTNQVAPTRFLARGEACQQSTDCAFLTCDPFVNKCVNGGVDPTSGESTCNNRWSDCNWNEYCSPADTTATPNIAATCKPTPGGFGSRGGALCKSASYVTGQCGWAQFCTSKTQDEVASSHTAYTLSTCQKPYSIPEGEMCPPDVGANTINIAAYGSNQAYSFCASGPCVASGPLGMPRCTSADTTYAGTGCRDDSECGRGMQCQCPSQGGSRARCMLSGTYQNWQQARKEWFQIAQPWLQCLDDNQCTLNSYAKGSCGNKHCASHDQSQEQHSCSTTPVYQQINVPNYRGYHDTIGAASHMMPTMSLLITLFITIYAILN